MPPLVILQTEMRQITENGHQKSHSASHFMRNHTVSGLCSLLPAHIISFAACFLLVLL